MMPMTVGMMMIMMRMMMMMMMMIMMRMMMMTMMVVSYKNHAMKINKKITDFRIARPLLAIVATGSRLAVSLLLIDSDLILFA